MSLSVQFLMLAALAAAPARLAREESAGETTAVAQKLVLERIDAIARAGRCREAFGQQQIDLARVRVVARQVRFYNAEGPEGDLRFSEVVGEPASPDHRLRDLSRGLSADAFVLGYQEDRRYIRTKHVVLSRGYFEQGRRATGRGARPRRRKNRPPAARNPAHRAKCGRPRSNAAGTLSLAPAVVLSGYVCGRSRGLETNSVHSSAFIETASRSAIGVSAALSSLEISVKPARRGTCWNTGGEDDQNLLPGAGAVLAQLPMIWPEPEPRPAYPPPPGSLGSPFRGPRPGVMLQDLFGFEVEPLAARLRTDAQLHSAATVFHSERGLNCIGSGPVNGGSKTLQ